MEDARDALNSPVDRCRGSSLSDPQIWCPSDLPQALLVAHESWALDRNTAVHCTLSCMAAVVTRGLPAVSLEVPQNVTHARKLPCFVCTRCRCSAVLPAAHRMLEPWCSQSPVHGTCPCLCTPCSPVSSAAGDALQFRLHLHCALLHACLCPCLRVCACTQCCAWSRCRHGLRTGRRHGRRERGGERQ